MDGNGSGSARIALFQKWRYFLFSLKWQQVSRMAREEPRTYTLDDLMDVPTLFHHSLLTNSCEKVYFALFHPLDIE